jgi:N-acetylglutamate synthase-like GNAT family acetyltransferase
MELAIDRLHVLKKRRLALNELTLLSAQLRANNLPSSDIETGAGRFFDFRTELNETVGYAGIEIFGPDALLRSLVVLPVWRHKGFGGSIVEKMAEFACDQGIERLYLLTVGAADFFAAWGFMVMPRLEAPVRIAAAAEFASLCPASAVFMCRDVRAAPPRRAIS